MTQMDGLDVVDCERCEELCESRSRIVNGVGPADADLLFVGEAPGANEDEQGEPFVGRSGDVLDETLRDVGLDRADVRITNCVRCRPPDNRDPHADELANCREYLETEIDRVDPEVVVTLGKVPAQHLLDRDVAVTGEAGTVHDVTVAGTPRPVLVCVHPAATLYDPSQKETFADTLAKAADFTDDESGQRRIGDF
ncbi:uracil-DNA glycosylase family protein [Halomicroarcula sp. GCM10025324]|uniref:uracil-DNA glycosylase n=1 Tax=Haloarcula TaxID=2237 RepID=UPI0023E7EAA9|nr:uracil-DNA glycosylase [Halomicroarcula sp. ZS-22-S1]